MPDEIRLGVVVPVYQGAMTLDRLVDELLAAGADLWQAHGVQLGEVVLVHDDAVDGSADVIERLAVEHDVVRPVWLSRNFGQHAATIAGVAATTADWVVTLDEDGLHDPACIGELLEAARGSGADLVYGHAAEQVPHAAWRNITSKVAKRAGRLLLGEEFPDRFTSLRLIEGQIGRAIAAYCGYGIFLDVALRWATTRIDHVEVPYRREERAGASGYDVHRLLSHFRRLVLSSGTRPLRLVASMGVLAFVVGVLAAAYAITMRLLGSVDQQGWASLMSALSISTGLVLMSIGVVAEYLGVTLGMAMGRPPYLAVDRRPRAPGEL